MVTSVINCIISLGNSLCLNKLALCLWSGSEAVPGVVTSAHAADLGAERFLHDKHNQSTVANDGPLCPRRGGE